MKQYQGLDEKEIALSREKYGSNRLKGKKKKSFVRKLFSNFQDPIVKVLLAALLVNVLFTLKNFNWFESIGIVMAIMISTLVSTISEYGSENAFEKLTESSEKRLSLVIREGKTQKIDVDDIVVGDLVILGAGEAVFADGVMVEGGISVDQSALNGESKEVKKRVLRKETPRTPESENRVFRGSLVTQGRAIMKVTEVGERTFLGGVASDLTQDTRESPLKLRLSALAKTISRIGYVLAAIVAVSFLFGQIVVNNHFDLDLIVATVRDVRSVLSLCIRALTLAITVVVVAVPEGLPMMICVVLSSNMKKMLADQILVKKLVGIETAGSLNLLFCDKTGTITTGVQSVEGIVLSNGSFVHNRQKIQGVSVYPYLLATASYNTDCSVVSGKIVGSNATDRAIANYFLSETKPQGAVYGGVPFHSRYKYSAAAMPDGKILIKGAPEVLIPYITHAFDEKGALTAFEQERVMKEYRRLASKSTRLVVIAITDQMPSALGFGELTFIAMIAIRDSIRDSAVDSVKTLHNAGISVVMVTGDSPDTARAIALETGIIQDPETQKVVTGQDLAVMTDQEVKELLPHLAVLARALPQDKTRLVRLAQSIGLVVGMTGDGVNDAPALKLSDVGFAMGSGTDIAKEAGDIVILDNDISAIVKAVLYGRTIFKSIQKFIVFQLTMNFCAVGVTLLGPLFGVSSPITIIQMLWINMIMDTLGGLAFAGEAPTSDTMTETPKRREAPLLSLEMLGKIFWNGFMTILVCIGFMSIEYIRKALSFYDNSIIFYSSFFSLFIFLGIMQFFNARTERLNLFSGLGRNKVFLVITALVLAVQLLMVYFGGSLFRTTPLSLRILLGVASLALTVIPIDTIRKMIMRLGLKQKRS